MKICVRRHCLWQLRLCHDGYAKLRENNRLIDASRLCNIQDIRPLKKQIILADNQI